MTELVDARGVEIGPGDTVIYGFAVGRSVAIAEGVVVGEENETAVQFGDHRQAVSLTPSGRVRVRVVRRSYGGGTKDVVDIAPDRLVVLKVSPYPDDLPAPYLPPSPLPTQREENRQRILNLIEHYKDDLRATEVPDSFRYYCKEGTLGAFHLHAVHQLKHLREELKEFDEG